MRVAAGLMPWLSVASNSNTLAVLTWVEGPGRQQLAALVRSVTDVNLFERLFDGEHAESVQVATDEVLIESDVLTTAQPDDAVRAVVARALFPPSSVYFADEKP